MRKILEPITVNHMTLKNRMVVSAMVTGFCKADGYATERFIAYHEAKAKGGWGLIIPEDYVIAPGVGGSRDLPGLFDDDQIASHKQLTDRIHVAGGKIACQIYHAGRRIIRSDNGIPPVAPSAIKFAGAPSEIPRELSKKEIEEIVVQFADCARRVKAAGFDAVEIHGAHGYLLHSFVSPFSNKRCDEYGGSIAGRSKFSVDVVKAVRQAVGEEFPILYRMSVMDGVDGGITIEEAKAMAMRLEAAGVDLLHVSQGGDFNYIVSPASSMPKACYIDHAAEIKKVVSIPVIGVGRINDPFLAEEILVSGKADLVTMARASLADPEFPNKVAAEQYEDINYCIGCLQGCTKGCLVNPITGHESEYNLAKTTQPKKVYVAGGGIAGCEAAIAAAMKGHHVVLFEQSGTLGGQWLAACVPPGKTDFATLVIWQKRRLQQLGVEVRLQTALTKEIVQTEQPDKIIIATGSKAVIPLIEGIHGDHVVLANDVLLGKKDVGKYVVVMGGGSVGAETADHLALHGSKVTVVEMLAEIADDASARPRKLLLERLAEKGVTLYTSTKVTAISQHAVLAEKNGKTFVIPDVDTVVVAAGVRSNTTLQEELQDFTDRIVLAGDARKAKDGYHNIREGFEAGLEI